MFPPGFPHPPVAPQVAHAAEVKRKLGELQTRAAQKPATREDDWPDGVDVAVQLTREATATALQLGHQMSEWMPHGGSWRARCVTCSAASVVSPRDMRVLPIRGEAVNLSCRRKA